VGLLVKVDLQIQAVVAVVEVIHLFMAAQAALA
jgi:hypothetical protein